MPASENGRPVRVATDVPADRFEQLFLDTLSARNTD